MNRSHYRAFVAALFSIALAGAAAAQTKLKWAHVYETSEPFHVWAEWASREIERRSNGKFEIAVFPSSSLGKETDINQGSQLGTVDVITSGVAFAARNYPRLGILPWLVPQLVTLLVLTYVPSIVLWLTRLRGMAG